MRNNQWSGQPEEDEMDFNAALHQRTEELYQIKNAKPNRSGIVTLAVLPLRDLVVFPHMVSPVFIVPGNTMTAVQFAQEKDLTMIGLVQTDPDIDQPTQKDFLPVGVELAVGRLLSMPDGNSSALVQGRRRVELVEFIQLEPFIIAKARVIEETKKADKPTDRIDADCPRSV